MVAQFSRCVIVSFRMWDRLKWLVSRQRAHSFASATNASGAARLGSSFPGPRRGSVIAPRRLPKPLDSEGESCACDTVSHEVTTRRSGTPPILGSSARSHPADCPLCPLEASSFQSDSMMESTAFDVSAAFEPCAPSWSPLCPGGAGADGGAGGLPGAGELGVAAEPGRSDPFRAPESPLGFSRMKRSNTWSNPSTNRSHGNAGA